LINVMGLHGGGKKVSVCLQHQDRQENNKLPFPKGNERKRKKKLSMKTNLDKKEVKKPA